MIRWIVAVAFVCPVILWNQPPLPGQAKASKTQVVMLGTGTPNADPDRSGPSLAVVVNDTPYILKDLAGRSSQRMTWMYIEEWWLVVSDWF